MDDESGSDWDSLTGDVEPQSAPEITPRPPSHSPVPPSIKSQSKKKPVVQSPKEDHTERVSTPNSLTASLKKEENVEMSPRNYYGKAGVTTFVDRGHDSEEEVSSRSKKGQKKTKRQTETRHKTPPTPQDAEQPVPFTLFQASGVQSGKSQPQPQPPKQKIKQSYIKAESPNGLALQGPKGQQDRWDSSDEEHTVNHKNQPPPPVTPGLVSVGYAPQHEGIGSTHGLLQTHSPEPHNKRISHQRSNMQAPDCCIPLGNGGTVERYTYYFDKAWNDTQVFVTADDKPDAMLPLIADRSEQWVRRFWQEVFGGLRLVIDFALIFVLELFEFTVHWIVLRLVMGILSVMGDHVVKPILTTLFNGFLQPLLIFFWNIASGIRNTVRPILDITRECILQFATLLRAFRLVEVNWRPEFNNGQRRNDHLVSEL